MKEPEFAGELFDALSRRRNISGDSISKAELLEFWDQISDTSFDGRLQTFFDMYVKLLLQTVVTPPLITDRQTLISLLAPRSSNQTLPSFGYPCRVDKDADGRITEEEVKEVTLSTAFLHSV